MSLIRLLIIALAVWLLVLVIKRWLGGRAKALPKDKAQDNPDMVRCAHCGLHLPKSEALSRDALYFCSRQHLDQHRG